MGPGMMKGMGPRHDARTGPQARDFADPAQLETLKTELEITPAQEQAWSKYAKAVQDAAAGMKTTRESVDPDAVEQDEPRGSLRFRQQDARAGAGAVRLP